MEPQANFESNKIKARSLWINLIKQNPEYSVTQIRSLSPKTYAWLYRNNRAWLKANSPKSSASKGTDDNHKIWFWFDLNLALATCKQVLELNKGIKSPKVTKTHLAFLIKEKSAVYKSKKNFFHLHQVFDALAESKFDFAKRRIWAGINSFNVEQPNKWRLIRHFGLGRIKNEIKVQLELNLAIEYLLSQAELAGSKHTCQLFPKLNLSSDDKSLAEKLLRGSR